MSIKSYAELSKSINEKLLSVENQVTDVEKQSNQKINDTEKILRGFIVDAQHDYLNRIDSLEAKIKRNFDQKILFNELNSLKNSFSWLKIVDVQKTAYQFAAPQTERFTEYLWVLKNLIKKCS